MPFDTAEYPEPDEPTPTDPMPVAHWLRYSVAALPILVGLVLPMWVVAWSLWRWPTTFGIFEREERLSRAVRPAVM
jgi:hypothetical protein